MNAIVFSTHNFERPFLEAANGGTHSLHMLELPLNAHTAALAQNAQAVSLFVNDDASLPVLQQLHRQGVRYLVLRSAGYNHVDLTAAASLGLKVARVPAYSPYAIAEHTIALMLALNRKLIRANNRVHELNFSLDGLTGFDMHGKTAGIIGTGKIGAIVARILKGFGCTVLAVDVAEDEQLKRELGLRYVDLPTLYRESDIITLHLPLNPQTHYLINKEAIGQMKRGVMLINTGRGGLIDTRAAIEGLKHGQIGYLGLDVYEEEGGLFFEDHSDEVLQDDVISRLLTFNNVLITSHQAFLTDSALRNIAETTIYNLDCFEQGIKGPNELDAG